MLKQGWQQIWICTYRMDKQVFLNDVFHKFHIPRLHSQIYLRKKNLPKAEHLVEIVCLWNGSLCLYERLLKLPTFLACPEHSLRSISYLKARQVQLASLSNLCRDMVSLAGLWCFAWRHNFQTYTQTRKQRIHQLTAAKNKFILKLGMEKTCKTMTFRALEVSAYNSSSLYA